MKKLKILYGICGLGNGHTYRQLPIVEHFSLNSEMLIFAHDNSYKFYASKFKDHPSVKIIEIAIPFYVGDKDGIDFRASCESPINQKDIFKMNCVALDRATKELGKADLVITDYEPVSAQYAYAYSLPLVTIDQQSKYLCGNLPKELAGFAFKDEVERLHMFFPKANARIACSFFKVPIRPGGDEVNLMPPTLKDSVIKMERKPKHNSIMIYISSAREFSQTPEEIIRVCSNFKDIEFHLFLGQSKLYDPKSFTNINIYQHGDPRFDEILRECSGIVSTAGHSLLSEAMYLGIPVYAIPVAPYEQHMNAGIVNKYGFGISYSKLNADRLKYFIEKIPDFSMAIEKDKEILLRGVGQKEIIKFLKNKFEF